LNASFSDLGLRVKALRRKGFLKLGFGILVGGLEG
jgi:hypothetical protein